MSQAEQRFQSFITRIRPHRVAVLANSVDPNWYHNCLGIIEFFTKLWGGSHSIIVPTDGETIDEEFWTILSSHDPDILYRYQPTGADLKSRSPSEFEELVSENVKECSRQTDIPEDEIRGQIERQALERAIYPWDVSENLQEKILMRLAPFHIAKQPLHGMPKPQLDITAISKGSKPHYPLTALLDVLKAGSKPAQVTQLGVTDLADSTLAPPRLWFAATIGCGDEEFFDELSQLQIKPVWTRVSENDVGGMIRLGIRPRRHTVDAFPLGMTMRALTSVRSGAARRFELPTIAVVGSSLKDFCLFFDLHWQQGRALWLPPWFMPEQGKYPYGLMAAIQEAEEAGRQDHNQRIVLISYSLAQGELLELKKSIQSIKPYASVEVEPVTATMVEMQVRHPSRIYTDGHIGNITTHMLLNNSLPGWFESPVPRTLNPVSPMSHRWVVDITFMENLIPRHPVLGRHAVSGPNVGEVRAGAECVSYMCPGMALFSDHMETNMLRPLIHVPDAEEIFRIILADSGYASETSDKGRYEVATIQKFGDLEKAAFAMYSGKHRTLLQKFLDKSRSQTGVFDQGVILKDNRRYLDFTSINQILGSEDLSRQIVDEYVGKGILNRGFVFVCESCSDAAWHSIAEVDQTFTCRRCGLKQQYKSASWKRPHEPSWFYKLDEMVYLMLENNGHVPLLTLNQLRLQSKESFLFRPELCIRREGSTKASLEIDICCVPNGKLCIGETKSKDSLKSDKMTPLQTAERYRDLALEIGASMVVFSTSADSWDNASQDAIQTAFEAHPHIQVLNWTSAILYG